MAEKVVVRDLRTLDALVAEHVMGWSVVTPDIYKGPRERWSVPEVQRPAGRPWPRWHMRPLWHWDPSKSLEEAWAVVERMREEGMRFRLDSTGGRESVGVTPWIASFDGFAKGGDSAPLAICLAALRAKGVEVELRLEGGDG